MTRRLSTYPEGHPDRPKGPPPAGGGYRAPNVPAPATTPCGGSSNQPAPSWHTVRRDTDPRGERISFHPLFEWPAPAPRRRGRVLVAFLGALVGGAIGAVAAVVFVLWILAT